MNRSLRNLSLTLLLTFSVLAGGCCLMDRHHGPNKEQCASMKPACQPCPDCPCKKAAVPAEAPAPAPTPDK